MADEDPEPDVPPEDHPAPVTVDPVGRPVPRRPGRDNEKALGLEVARLFGVSPRLLVAPASPPADPDDQEAGEPGG
jgi:hypothetical protein